MFEKKDDSKPVIDCLKINLIRNDCVSYFKVNFSHCLHWRKVQRKKEKKQKKIKLS